MSYTTINKPSDYFNTKLYTGTGSASQAQTGVGFQPDLVWTKSRSNTYPHQWYDVIRGVTKKIQSNDTSAEATQANGLSSFDSDGFTVGDASGTGVNSATYASWNWKANGAGVANTDGTITSTVSANTTSGFSIVSYTGNSTSGATVGHGLGAVPSMIIWKDLGINSWGVYHKSLGNTNAMFLDLTNASTSFSTLVNNTTPSSSLITLGSSTNSNNSRGMIAYCFAEKQGFSKFGSYVGNGNADGSFIYTGFKPSFIMYKKSSGTGRWTMEDNKRDPFNVATHGLEANGSSVENTGSNYWDVDLLSNGFKLRTTEQETNQSGQTFIYMAFAEASLVGTNGVTAKGR